MILSKSNYKLENILNIDWDFVIIGSGIGGGVMAHELISNTNLKILMIEKGSLSYENNERPNYWWREKVQGITSYGNLKHYLSIGCGVGGSSNLFAAQMERMKEIDFDNSSLKLDKDFFMINWPLNFNEFNNFYEKAEKLFKIHGSNDPLDGIKSQSLITPPKLTKFNEFFFSELKDCGLNPYRSHVATEINSNCDGCAEIKCNFECKNDTYKICIKPSLNNKNFTLISNCEVLRINSNSDIIESISCFYDNKEITIKAKKYILSAGAINSPLLLLKSKSPKWPNGISNDNDLIGRNLMWHISEIFAIKPKRIKQQSFSKRQISFNDFYLTKKGKFGNLQEMGFNWFNYEKIYLILKNKFKFFYFKPINLFFKIIAKIISAYFKNCVMYASVIEDYPKLYNRVFYDNNKIKYEYYLDKILIKRIKTFKKEFKSKLNKRFSIIKISGRNNINYGHPMGTCKMGIDSKKSVLDINNKLHQINNMYVVDSSFFPSSSGINPSLTIAANAIRVAEFIKKNDK